MSGTYGHGHHSGPYIAAALTSGHLTSLMFDGTLTGTYAGDVIVALSSDGSDLTIQSAYDWLSIEGYAASDTYGAEVAAALNAGGLWAVPYTGADPDSVYGNTIVVADSAGGSYTVTVTTGWPT